jgi:hypothetical protein
MRLKTFTESNTWTTPVLVNEFDASGFEGPTHCQIICRRHRCLAFCQFSASDGGDA